MEPIEKLSCEDKQLIRASFAVVQKKIRECAVNIFEMIFSQSPDTKQMFPFMKQGDKRSKEMIQFHGLRFMQVIESIANSIDNPSAIEPVLDNLGRVHGRLAENKGFRAYHWGVFIECTLYHFRQVLSKELSHDQVDHSIIVWRTVLRVVINRMKRGLATDLQNRQANREHEEQLVETSSQGSPQSIPKCPISHSVTLPSISTGSECGLGERAKAEPSRLRFFRFFCCARSNKDRCRPIASN